MLLMLTAGFNYQWYVNSIERRPTETPRNRAEVLTEVTKALCEISEKDFVIRAIRSSFSSYVVLQSEIVCPQSLEISQKQGNRLIAKMTVEVLSLTVNLWNFLK